MRILDQELSVEPLDATTALYQAIQERRDLEPASDAGAATIGNHAPTTVASPAREHPVVGREQELATLAAALDGAASGGQLVVHKTMQPASVGIWLPRPQRRE